MSDSSGSTGQVSRMDAFKGQVKKAVLIFITLDLVFVGGAVALFFGIYRPEMKKAEAARDEAVRTAVAMQVRARAVEARYALTVMDLGGARMAAGDVRAGLLGLAERVPAERTQEAAEVKQLVDRAALLEGALQVDPNAARKDLELLESKLVALYPAAPPTPGR
jgi:hypothetical protein